MQSGNTTPYSAAFFDELDRKTWRSAEAVVPIVMRLLTPVSVIDVGCGRGVWLAAFQNAGVDKTFGVDGPWVKPESLHIPRECFAVADLTSEWTAPGAYDLAVCLEVAEHLPNRCGAALVAKLAGLAPAVLFSAAIPGQGGTGHVNEQWPDYWKDHFRRHEFFRLDPVRRMIWQNDRVAWFYQQNIFLYVRKDVIRAVSELGRELELADQCSMTLVHSKILGKMTSLRGAFGLIPRLILAAIRRRLTGA
jgi:hypothetical protein